MRRESAQYAAQHIMGLASGVYDYLPFFYRRGALLGLGRGALTSTKPYSFP